MYRIVVIFDAIFEIFLLISRSEEHRNQNGNGYHNTYHTGHQQHMNFMLNFLTKTHGNDLYLEVGDYSYPFQFILPINLPSSFEHFIGKTRYTVEGTIDIPW